MLSERLQHSISGEVRFSVKGGFVPQFMSLCRQQNIALSDTRMQDQELYACIDRNDLQKLVAVCEKSGMQLQIRKKRGLAFVLRRYRLRWGIPVGLALGLLVLGVLSSMVWQVQINGCETLSEDYIREYFEELGVRTGVLQSSVDIVACRDRAMLDIRELLWVSVYMKGCTACIEIRERDAVKQLPEDGSCNLIASYGGEIIRADVYAGESYIKKGQAVAKGDILVGGGVPLKNGGVRFVRSQADIVARTHRSLQATVLLNYEAPVMHKQRIRYVPEWFGLRIPLGLRFGFSVAESTLLQPEINGVRLPFMLHRQGLRKQTQKQVQISERLALLQCFSLFALQETQLMQDKTVCSRKLAVECSGSCVTVSGSYICEENIVQEQELQIEAEN